MNTNITIGQYYPIDSKIHRLDARIKLFGIMLYITSLFFVTNFFGYVVSFLFLCVVIFMSKVPVKYMLKGLKSIIFIITFTLILNIFLTPGENVIFSFSIFKVTSEGLALGLKMAVRLILLVVGSSILTLTTSPIELTDAIEFTLKPFKKIGVPSHEIAMMMTITLRFIPTLIEEMDKIIKAQTARGADFDTGGLLQKAKSLIPVLVPLFLSSFRRAEDLAMAMEARCYRGDINRTRMKVMKVTKIDYYALGYLMMFVFALYCTRGQILLFSK